MMLEFEKYQGTGNDFIMLDNMNGQYDWLTNEQISFLCDRRFGIGADGLIRLNRVDGYDFELDYFNADGSKSFCGNGARCGLAYAFKHSYCGEKAYFLGIDGPHEGLVRDGVYSIKMIDVPTVNELSENEFETNTGSPHYIKFEKEIEQLNVVELGREIRNSSAYIKSGINVNFASIEASNDLRIRTYERGVEDETFSCGTGATACALAYVYANNIYGFHEVNVKVKGGELIISFERDANGLFHHILLNGPANFVFQGMIEVNENQI